LNRILETETERLKMFVKCSVGIRITSFHKFILFYFAENIVKIIISLEHLIEKSLILNKKCIAFILKVTIDTDTVIGYG